MPGDDGHDLIAVRRWLRQAHGQRLAALGQYLQPWLPFGHAGQQLQHVAGIARPLVCIGRPLRQGLPGQANPRAEQQHPPGLKALPERLQVTLPKRLDRTIKFSELHPHRGLSASLRLRMGGGSRLHGHGAGRPQKAMRPVMPGRTAPSGLSNSAMTSTRPLEGSVTGETKTT